MKSELIKEVWKPVLGYESLYEVSNFGRVKSFDHYVKTWFGKRLCRGKIIKSLNKSGYLQVCLSKNSLKTWFLVHRLVWEAFNGKITEGMEVNHIDETPLNNRLDNLNLMSHKDNINFGNGNDRRKKSNVNNPKQSYVVYQYTLDGVLVHVWPSIKEAGRNGYHEGHIWACCRGKQKTHKGFLWSYTPIN